MARKRDFTMFSGDTKTLAVSVTEESDNSPTNIENATVAWKVARSLKTAAVISKSTSSGITITSGTLGLLEITLDPADTASLSGDYMHELQITFQDGEVATVMKGVMTVEPDLI